MEEMKKNMQASSKSGSDYEEHDGYSDEEEDDDDDEPENTQIITSFACEDCDYRWEVTFADEEEEALDEVQYCPMCGSSNTTQI